MTLEPRLYLVECNLWYRDTSLMRNRAPLGSYSKTMPRAPWRPCGLMLFLMSEIHLYIIGTPLWHIPRRVQDSGFKVWGLG